MDRIVVTPENFAKVLGAVVEEFAAEQEAELVKIVEDEAQKTVEDLRQRSPKRTGKYAKSWTLNKPSKRARGNKVRGGNNIYTIYNKKHYRLTHLLEKGAIRATKGILKPIPHITPAYEKAKKNIEEKTGGY